MIYNTGNYDKYMTKNPLKRKMVNRLNDTIISCVGDYLKPGMSILDAGCGEGFIDHLLFESFTSIKVTGLEFTDEAIAIAKEMNPQAEYIQGDIQQLPFSDVSFDVVVCTEVLEHVPRPDLALKELERVAKGFLLITVPHEPWFRFGNLIVLKNVSRLGDPIDHINHWTKGSFKRFLKKNGGGGEHVISSFPWTVAFYTKK